MTETFDKTRLHQVFIDIENYLAYLKGNELAYDYLERARSEMARSAQDGESTFVVRLEGDYQFPCPDRRWTVSPDESVRQFAVSTHVERGVDEQELQTRVARQIQGYADEAWHDGASWASGLATYLFSLCARFAEPDVTRLADGIIAMQKQVLSEVDEGSKPDWADIGHTLGQWTGESANAFDSFSGDYFWYKATWGNYVGYAVTGFIAATRIIDRTQRGAMKYADSMSTALRDHLDTWTSFRRPPEAPPKPPAWVAKVQQIAGHAYELLDHVPVVKDVKGTVDTAVSIAGTVANIGLELGVEIPEHEEPRIHARRADDLYTEMTRVLNEDYDEAYWLALGRLEEGPRLGPRGKDGFGGRKVLTNLHQLQHADDWLPRPVPRTSAYDPRRDTQYS